MSSKGKGKGKGKGKSKEEKEALELTLKRLKKSYLDNCKQFNFPPERLFVKKINGYIEDGADDFGNEIPSQFIFPYGPEPFGPIGARVAVNTFLAYQFYAKYLKHVCFYRAALGDEGIDAIVDLVKPRDCFVKNLELVDCGLTASGMTYLGIAIKTNISLLTLVIDHNNIGDEGVKNLTRQGLITNKTLQCLSMKYCGIGPEGGLIIGAELLSHCVFPTLTLSGNMLGNEGVLHVFNGLRKNEYLKSLNVDNCFFGDEAYSFERIKEALQENTTLTKLNLTGNLFPNQHASTSSGLVHPGESFDFAQVLLELLRTNRNLTTLGTVGELPTAKMDTQTFKDLRRETTINKKNVAKKAKKSGKKGGKKKGKKGAKK